MTSQVLTLFLGKIFGALAGIALVRYLGAEMQGVYSYILSIIFLLSFITDFGLQSLLVREIKISGSGSPKFFGNALMLQVFQILVSGALIAAYSMTFEKNPAVKLPLLYASFAMTLMYLSNPFTAALSSHEKMHLSGLAGGLASILNAIFIFISISLKFTLPQIILMLGASNALSALVSGFLCVRYAVKPDFTFDAGILKKMIIMSLPFAAMGLFNYMYEKVNVLILFSMKGAVEAGYYGGAAKVIEILNAFVVAIMAPVYPRLSVIINTESKEKAVRVINLSVKYLAFAAAPCALFVSALSSDWTNLLLGAKFQHSAPALALLIWTIFLMCMHIIPGYALNSARLTKLVTLVYGINIVLNLALNFAFTPSYGYLATSSASVACNAFAFITIIYFTDKNIGKTLIPKYFLKIFTSLIPACLIIFLLKENVNYIILSALSALTFMASAFLLRYFDGDDAALFVKIVSGIAKFLPFKKSV
ncbi:MAG TPA: flippase [Candidatus Goldiibacteriota bacterium]|nr:flippase [Candidatus Goldiibacteriota bacterium]HRQ43039.1 flippase [Candidatus Goldiibacteriota bacterium]